MSDMQYDAPSIRLVNDLIAKAVHAGASDIHLESYQNAVQVRLRIDGMLHAEGSIEAAYMSQVLNRIKILAQLDIAEKRMPQDGKFLHPLLTNDVDLRVSTFPTLYGEKIVIRILDRSGTQLIPEQLGFELVMLERLKTIVKRAHGFFLVTGPTGSGKTTTLYSLLSYVKAPHINITTLEDPIEYYVSGVNQAQVHPAIGFTFARGIRSLLRQDPDIIMVGEIRDQETAQVAVQASLTGHMVLSTLHTADAPSCVMRLLDMSIEPFLLNTTLTGILAQRLARTLCVHCKYESAISSHEQHYIDTYKLSITNTYAAKGCIQCRNTGYKGRTGVFELLEISHELRALLTAQPVFSDIYIQAVKDGMKPLIFDAAEKVNQGIISMQELIRVLL